MAMFVGFMGHLRERPSVMFGVIWMLIKNNQGQFSCQELPELVNGRIRIKVPHCLYAL